MEETGLINQLVCLLVNNRNQILNRPSDLKLTELPFPQLPKGMAFVPMEMIEQMDPAKKDKVRATLQKWWASRPEKAVLLQKKILHQEN
jgi:hypothetical protein